MARQTLLAEFGRAVAPKLPLDLQQPGASFVTLLKAGRLRGCIGSLEACQPLGQDIIDNTRRAAFRDPRFEPLAAHELAELVIEVSLLDDPEPMVVADEADLLAQLTPGEDGLIVQMEGRRATFLPSVWQQLGSPREFVVALKHKAGMAGDFWSANMRWWRYRSARIEGDLLES